MDFKAGMHIYKLMHYQITEYKVLPQLPTATGNISNTKNIRLLQVESDQVVTYLKSSLENNDDIFLSRVVALHHQRGQLIAALKINEQMLKDHRQKFQETNFDEI